MNNNRVKQKIGRIYFYIKEELNDYTFRIYQIMLLKTIQIKEKML